jgi:hypothetical protein
MKMVNRNTDLGLALTTPNNGDAGRVCLGSGDNIS